MKTKVLFTTVLSSIALLFAATGFAADNGVAHESPDPQMSMVKENLEHGMNWFGGEPYLGEPALEATAALVRAGGGADDFSFSQALVAMLGEDTVNAEVAKLTEQYGEDDVKAFVNGMTYAVNTGLKLATEAGVTLPEPPADLKGVKLAKALVQAGVGPSGAFWSGRMFDVALSHQLHNAVMADIEQNVSHYADWNTHRILNQAMYDVAQALGMKDVKLASFH